MLANSCRIAPIGRPPQASIHPSSKIYLTFVLTNGRHLCSRIMIEAYYSCNNADTDPGLLVFLRYLPQTGRRPDAEILQR
jgi:hypothetical protein